MSFPLAKLPIGKIGGKLGEKPGWKVIAGALAAVLVVAGIGGYAAAQSAKGNVAAGIEEGVVEKGDISQNIVATGSLSAKKSVNVLVPAGLEVSEVLVDKGDTVSKGTKIAKVTRESVNARLLLIEQDIDSTQRQLDALWSGSDHYELQKQVLQDQIADLKSDRDAMKSLLETLVLKPDVNGTVDSVSLFAGTPTGQQSKKDAKVEDSGKSSSGNGSGSSSGSINGASGGTASGAQDGSATASHAAFKVNEDAPAASADVKGKDADGVFAPSTPAVPETRASEGEDDSKPDSESEVPAPVQLHGKIDLKIAPPATGAVAQDDPGIPKEVDQYSGTISWVPADGVFAPQTEYSCTVYLTAADGYCFTPDASKIDVFVPGSDNGFFDILDLDGDGYAETIRVGAYFPATQATLSENDSQGDQQADLQMQASSNEDLLGSFGGGSSGGDALGGDSSGGGSLTKSGSSYSDTEAIAITVTPSDEIFVTAKIDEMDITKVSVGQKAQVTIDSLGDKTFEGEISEISNTPENASDSSSTAKYAVLVKLPLDEKMKFGMSASVNVLVDSQEGAALVPLAAISKGDGASRVYTAVDDKGALTQPVEVKTGLSDGERVQIVSGLNVGDKIYYTEAPADDGMYTGN